MNKNERINELLDIIRKDEVNFPDSWSESFMVGEFLYSHYVDSDRNYLSIKFSKNNCTYEINFNSYFKEYDFDNADFIIDKLERLIEYKKPIKEENISITVNFSNKSELKEFLEKLN